MSKSISSAGLLYVYLSGYEENGNVYIEQTDTYHYIGDELYYRIMAAADFADEYEDTVQIFAVVGLKEKANIVFSIVEDGIRTNFQRILSHKKIKTSTKKLDNTGNIFFRCAQEFYCEQLNHFPKKIYLENEDIIFGGICCSSILDGRADSIAEAMVALWLERENPMLCGLQLMTRSFFMMDFIGRKVITVLPDTATGFWRLIFEGGHQLYLREGAPYMKETVHPNDLGMFSMSNLQSVLLNPIYGYGKWFQPNDICEEWHKVFLYLCAVSDVAWNKSDIRKVYEKFLVFLEKNICLTTEADTFISKEEHCETLLIHIANFRSFLQGEDEPVISKDLHQTLNSRYIYLPYLWTLLNPEIPESIFSLTELQNLIERAADETDINNKGTLWEDAAAYVLNNVDGWKITGRRIRAGAQEIDLSIANISLDNELWQLGAYILVECKNWNTHVDIHQIRNIAHISNMKGNKTAILFAANGITTDAQEEIYRLAANNLSIICITMRDLNHLHSAEDCRTLILERWEYLQNSIKLATMI